MEIEASHLHSFHSVVGRFFFQLLEAEPRRGGACACCDSLHVPHHVQQDVSEGADYHSLRVSDCKPFLPTQPDPLTQLVNAWYCAFIYFSVEAEDWTQLGLYAFSAVVLLVFGICGIVVTVIESERCVGMVNHYHKLTFLTSRCSFHA